MNIAGPTGMNDDQENAGYNRGLGLEYVAGGAALPLQSNSDTLGLYPPQEVAIDRVYYAIFHGYLEHLGISLAQETYCFYRPVGYTICMRKLAQISNSTVRDLKVIVKISTPDQNRTLTNRIKRYTM